MDIFVEMPSGMDLSEMHEIVEEVRDLQTVRIDDRRPVFNDWFK